MKVLITGVAGFLGSHLADEFLRKGWEVKGIDNLVGGYYENIPSKVEFFKKDLGDFDSVKDCFQEVDVVVHAACSAYEGLSVFSPSFVTLNTFHITSVALSCAIQSNVKKFVHMSSMARYGTQEVVPFVEEAVPKPQDPYGIAKFASEMLIRNLCEVHGMRYVILVPHNIIGPRQKYDDPYRNVASIMINRMLQGKQPIIYGDGSQKRCFSFVKDLIGPLMRACETEVVDGMTVNIGPDEEFISIKDLAFLLGSLLDFKVEPVYVQERPQEVKNANCSANLARKLLQYSTTTSLETGLIEMIAWIKQNGTRNFEYHLPIEIVKKNTPKTWTDKLI